ncbi:MAG: hypothetical protein JNM88_05820 [Chitinophagaceae bacterium]|nr:hypothetical protein [Chitinophagaceae bacterium]
MRSYLSEKNIVVALFVLVLITFSLAQEDSKKMEEQYSGTSVSAVYDYVGNPGASKATFKTQQEPVKSFTE